MMDGRSPRIHLSLMIWTLLLIGLVLVEIRRLPPGLTALLVPYLTLMEWHWIGHLRQGDFIEPAMSLDFAAESPSHDESEECADSPGSGDRSGGDDAPMPASPRPTEEQVTPPSRRTRSRRRTRAPEPDPSAASWVQVGPGRFVRVDEMEPGPPAAQPDVGSGSDAPHGATSADEPGVTPEAGSIPADTEAAVALSEPGPDHAGRKTAEIGVPDDREIGEEATLGSLATATYLIVCPAGDPDDPGRSVATSGSRPEVESDEGGEEMSRAEVPELDLAGDEPVDRPRRLEEPRAIGDQEDEEARLIQG
jgi:hypothetical protein